MESVPEAQQQPTLTSTNEVSLITDRVALMTIQDNHQNVSTSSVKTKKNAPTETPSLPIPHAASSAHEPSQPPPPSFDSSLFQRIATLSEVGTSNHEVWSALYTPYNKTFALKRVNRQDAKSAGLHRRFRHAHIIRTYGVFKEAAHINNSQYVIVTEYVPDGSLQSMLDRVKNISERTTRRVMYQVSLAVTYLHQWHHLAHTDIKLSNILLDTTQHCVKLCDFDSLTDMSKENNWETPKCSLDYMPPEFCSHPGIGGGMYHHSRNGSGRAEYHKVDVWGIGVCTYAMIAGRPPFARDSVLATMRAIMMEELPFDEAAWSKVSAEAVSFIRMCCIKDPRRRPSIQEVLKHPWLLTGPATN